MRVTKYIKEAVARAGGKQSPLRLGMIDDSYIDYISEAEFWGNRTYWHGSHSPKTETDPSIINKLKPEGGYDEIYFSTYFGYSLAYALRLKNYDVFKSIADAEDLVNTGKKIISLSTDTQRLIQDSIKEHNENWWMILFKIKGKTRIFHSYSYDDMKLLQIAMSGSKNPKIMDFMGKMGTKEYLSGDTFHAKMEPLKTIDWLADIPKHFPFTREELLYEIRNYKANGRYIFQGYVNCEKGNYASIGLFNEHLSQLLVGPLYQVNLTNDKDQLLIKRYGTSVNASIHPDFPPNSPSKLEN